MQRQKKAKKENLGERKNNFLSTAIKCTAVFFACQDVFKHSSKEPKNKSNEEERQVNYEDTHSCFK